jgi:hypothetical protein
VTLPVASTPTAAPASPDPGAGSPLRRFVAGLAAVAQGYGFALRHTDVLLLCGAALACYGAVWLAAIALAMRFDGVVVDALVSSLGNAAWQRALTQVARAFGYLAFWLATLTSAFALALPACAPIFSVLAERTERRWYAGCETPAHSWRAIAGEMMAGAGRALLLAAIQLVGSVTLWLPGLALGFVAPPLGPLYAALVVGGWNALWYTVAATGFVLENNHTRAHDQLMAVRSNWPVFVGFGAAAQWLAWLPPNVPFLVVGATLLTCRLRDHGHCRLPARDAALAAAEVAPEPARH